MKKHSMVQLIGFLLALGLALPALAQSDRAGVVGTVKDPSGAVVPSAQIKVINVATGQSYDTAGGSDGTYTVPSILEPGNYKVQASHSGFKTATTEAFTLQIGDMKKVDIVLQLGAVSQEVTVTSAPSALQTQTSDVGAVVTGREVVDLPLKDRNFTQLATLQPGVSSAYVGVLTDATAFNQGDPRAGSPPGGSNPQGSTEASRFSRSAGASISVNGLRPTNNNFTLDGVDNNEPQFGTIGVFPNPDAIGEFKIDTNDAKAEYGRGGAVVNVIYKSGTNTPHGEVYYFGQNDALNASDFVLNKNNLKKSVVRINEFGFAVGGPVMLPHYDGRNRTFFFADFLGQRNLFPNTFVTAVPTAKSRNGDFSDFDAPVIDPLTCTTPGDTSSGGCQQFPGNIIPNLKSRPDFSPQGFGLLDAYPLPNIPNVRNPDNGNPNFGGTRRNREKINSFDIKGDQKFGSANSLSARFTHDNQQRLRDNFFPGLPTAGFGAGQEIGNTRQVVISDTHIFTPTVLNEARFGWTKVDIGILNCGVEGACGSPPDFCTQLGIPNCNKGTPATTGGLLTGGFGSGFLEFTGDGGLFEVRSNNFYVADDVTIIHGKHTVKTGVSARPTKLATIDGGRSGNLKGHLQYCTPCNGDVGNIQADYLLQRPAIFSQSGTIEGGDNPLELRKTEWAFYVQDDWKATPNLTLNIGLRYELFPEFHETDARLANFDLATRSIIRAKGNDSLVNTDKSNWGPRFGFAYNFGPKKQFVFRGGYGLFHSEDAVNFPPLGSNPPVISSVAFDNFSGVTNDFNLTTGPPVAPVENPPLITANSSLVTVPKNQIIPTIHEWHVGAQWEFARSYLLDVGYAASRGRHLLATRNLGGGGNGLGVALDPAGDHINDDLLFENRASSAYNSLQASLRMRYSHGLTFLASYTYAHGIDDSTGAFNAIGETRGASGGPVDPFDFSLDRGNSSLDHRHIFVLSGIWDLPFGKGRPFANNVGNKVDRVIGGWQLNFIQTAQTGQHFDVQANSPGSGSTRADIIGDPFAGTNSDLFLNAAAFAPPAASVTNLAGNKIFVGNLSRNAFTGPDLLVTNLSIFKTTPITEHLKVQFRADFFNAWNHVNRLVPNNNISQGGFGTFDSAFPPRTIQYALKLIF